MEVQNMGAYKNDYKKKEDYSLWELHEIRHKIHKEYKGNEEINKMGKKLFNEIKSNKGKKLTEEKSKNKRAS